MITFRITILACCLAFAAACTSDDDAAATDQDTGTTTEGATTGEPATEGCSTEPGGLDIGDLVMDVDIRRCSGETVSLRQVACGAAVTFIDVGTASMGPCVEATKAYATAPEYVALKADGLQIVQVFRDDQGGDPPTKSWCTQYAAQNEVDFEFLTDPFHQTDAFDLTFPLYIVVGPDARILDIWSHALNEVPTDRVPALRSLLDQANVTQ
ncbi:MAG: hypothetical protein ACI9WU_001346 [Myxococcota bacterium]|jgi:hypothetical protein